MPRGTASLVLVGLTAACWSWPAKADTPRYSAHYEACSAKAGGSYTQIIACLAEEQAYQEAALNRTYRAALARSTKAARKQLLRQSERSWLVERGRKCAMQSADAGLSDLVDRRQCLLDETSRRTNWLRHY